MAEKSGVEDVSKEELAALLPSERAALLDENEDESDEAPAEDGSDAAADEVDDTSIDDSKEEGGDEGGDADPAEEGEAEEAAAAPAETEAVADDDDDDMPAFRFVPDGDYKAKRAELVKQFEDSEMTLDEYTDKLDQLRAEHEGRQHNEYVWDRTCRQFFRENPTFKKEASPILYGMLDQAVKAVAVDPANADKSGKWMLKTAHQKVLDELKAVTGSDTIKPKGAAKPAAKADAKPRPKAPDASKLPKTLGNLPEAEPGDAGDADDWMSELDRLADKDPLGYEQALARLPKHKEKAYLESR